jgi:hypothetical protein
VRILRALARPTWTSPENRAASTTWMRRPSRITRVDGVERSAIGTARNRSTVKRTTCIGAAVGTASMARAISPDGGLPCMCSSSQPPRVSSEGTKRSPSRVKRAAIAEAR